MPNSTLKRNLCTVDTDSYYLATEYYSYNLQVKHLILADDDDDDLDLYFFYCIHVSGDCVWYVSIRGG